VQQHHACFFHSHSVSLREDGPTHYPLPTLSLIPLACCTVAHFKRWPSPLHSSLDSTEMEMADQGLGYGILFHLTALVRRARRARAIRTSSYAKDPPGAAPAPWLQREACSPAAEGT
jgi:hypothetical protein